MRLQAHSALDLISDVWNDLNGVSEVFPAAFFSDDFRINLPCCHVCRLGQVDVEKAFIVANIEICFGTVFGNKNFTVLEGVHRARVNVEIRVKLLHHDTKTTCGEKIAQASCCQPFTE